MQKSVVLLSGGLDSATCLAIASQENDVHALTMDYGSRHSKEIEAARRIAGHFHVVNHVILKLGLDAIGGSSLTDRNISLDKAKNKDSIGLDIPTSYVPARNMTFLSLGVGFAEVVGAGKLYIGANSIDYSGYPDCRPEFIDAFQRVVDVGTRTGVQGQTIRIEAPLLRLGKTDIIRKGIELGVPYEHTWTCYSGGEKACGKCEACVLRLAGFEEAGFDDPIEYEH